MKDMLSITKALADESRLRALMVLRHGELCVCQIIELLGLAPSTVSKHMSLLRQAGLVISRKEGRWIHYRLAGREASAAAREALTFVTRQLADVPQVHQDDADLQIILEIDKEALCQRQTKK